MKKHKTGTKKHPGKAVKRHIEDVPFYKFRYGIDDLPLDPAKPFILEQIARVKLIRPTEDNVEFYFQDFPSLDDPDKGACGVDGDSDTEKHDIKDIRMPDHFQLLKEKPKYIYSFSKPEPYHYPWLDNLNLEKPSEASVHKVTTEILNIYRERRVNIFHEPTVTRSALYSNEHQKLYSGPSDTIGAFKSAKAAALRLPALRKRKKSPEFRAGNPWAVRTTEEIKAELARVSKVIDKLIEPDIKRGRIARSRSLEAEPTKKTEKCDICKVKKYSEPKKPKIFDPQAYMEKILRKEQEKFKYMEGLLPVDPEEQKARMLQEYEYKMEKRSEKFTTSIERRTISLMKNMSVLKLETYPSKLIKKLLPKIDTSIPYLREAYKFIQREEKLWPDIFPEVMLMDYLFNPENRIKEAEAILIISCLIDLQEDYRFHVKRDFLRYILESRFERKRLQLEREPPDFPILFIKSPVPWKARVQIARNRLDQVFMITHPVLQALNTLWHQLYHDILIFDTRKLYSCDIPLNADEITELLNKSCLAVRDILLNDWLPRCADLLDAMRNTWKDLIPMNSSYGGRAAILFNCVHALMSYHLQGLIGRSIKHFYKVLCVYRGGNLIDSYDPENKKLLRRPLMTLVVSVVGKHFSKQEDSCEQRGSHIYRVDKSDPMLTSPGFHETEGIKNYFSTDFVIANTGKMFAYPYMNELPNLFVSYFINILKVGYDIPRLEYVMSQREEEYGHLHYIDEYHVDMELLYDDVRQIVENNSTGPTTYLYPIYRYYCPLLNGQMRIITESIFTQIVLPGLPLFEVLMAKLQTLLDDIYCLRNFVPLNLFMLDNRHANETLSMLVHEIIDFITNYFRILNVNENRRICDDLEEMSMKAGERPEETAEVVALQNYLNECKDERILKIKDEIKEVLKRVIFLLYYATLDGDDIHLNTRTFLLPSELEQVLELSANRLSVVRENLEIALKERRTQFEGYINSEKRRMEAFRSRETHDIMSLEELKEKVDIIDELFGILEKCSREAKAINVDENLLQIDQSFFPVLTELVEKMEPIEKLWKTAYEFEKSYEIWMYGPFTDLNADGVREEIDGMYKVVYRLIRQLTNNPSAKRVAEQTRQKIDKFRVYLPIMDSICREGLETRHWDQITVKLGKPCNPGLYPSLKNMIDIDIMSILPQLEEISNAAYKEYELNKQLIMMQTDWLGVEFEVFRYRDSDTFILAALDDIQTILDDQVLKAQAMRRSPYIAALGTKADDWENKLIEMQDVLDQWIQVQSTWMYLEPIFSSEDIMRQMPVEGRNFKAVDKVFRKIMKYTNAHKSVIEATDYPDLLKIFRAFVQELEAVQKGLNTYLEQKRLFFARFFFLSNDELLEILSETKDPMRVQPHLKKCFEGIYFLNFNEEMEITAMISAENEVVKLVRKVNPNAANGLVELWLKDVESAMLDSLHEEMRLATEDYAATEREIWVTAWPGQVVQGIACLMWTVECEEAIVDRQLDICLEKNNQQIRGLVHLVRTNLGKGTRITIEALIVLDVHARDIVLYLVEKKVGDTADFDWISQLRYYWRLEEKAPDWVAVSMVVTDVKYGMEYLGNISRLVVTPLTDRCFRTLMGALKLCMGGAPEGPAGTGKTESTKDLAKSVATKCVVFNCSDGLDYKALGKFFKGLAQSGAWACFDEFNRIELEVLSVVAQQILTIQRAIAKKVVKFFFEDTWLRLDPTCAVFITMNPGYAGRTELPDNLKVLFRTVAMMVPDYAMIGEITLYSNGFDEARPLAQKIVHTYKLCSEQLSSQSHYDYGMRAVKSVLLASSSLRQLHPNLPEAQVVLRAIIDVNLPKFLEQDVSLFIGIYNDLFPGIEVPQPARDDVLRWIYKVLADKNLQATAWYIEKILQVYEMLLVRHGLMIVGAPMGGKTTSYQTLAIALKGVSADKTAKAVEYPVSYRIINPKAISMGQLYGNFDPISHEWSDGVLAKTFRDMATIDEEERNWVLFDGPVDAVWIENLNTVLDDNKKLCLMSGEIIIMSKFMNMMFEPADLEQASPATVSRCGMIYMEPALLGWRCVHKSFFAELGTTGLNDIYMALYEQLVEWLIPAAHWALKSCDQLLDVPPLYKYQMMSLFFKYYLSKQKQLTQIWFQQTFLFCFAWAFASTLTADGHRSFDGLIRKILYGGNEDFPKPKHFSLNRGQMFPEKFPLTDYRFDLAENWWPWLKTDEIVFEHGKQISELIVPTKETGLLTYWMEASMAIGRPFLVCGPTGTGKSATINNYILGLPKQTNLLNVINFSARTSAQQVQESVMMKLDRRRKGVFGPPVGKKCVVFCDNVAMPSRDTYGSQPPLELIRQWFDHGYWSDLKDTTKIELIDLLFLGAMGVPGGSNFIFPRFYRHCFTVAVDAFDDATIVRIFQTIGEWHFNKEFPEKVVLLNKGLSEAMVNIYREAMAVFLPTPAKSHYTFSLRDVTRTFQGIVLVPAKRLTDPEKLARLWAHETYRVFYDRLIEQRDRDLLLDMTKRTCKACFRFTLEQAMGDRLESNVVTDSDMRSLFYGTYMEPDADPKIYDEVENYEKLEKVMHYYLQDYNTFSKTPMDLVLFRYAIEHISRTARVLQMPSGNILMVGMGGSGRRSAAKLAASIAEAKLCTVTITKTYSMNDWREDIKKMLMGAGTSFKPTVFLFSDTQAVDEAFIEDINGILNTGDLPNLYTGEDKAAILEAVSRVAKELERKIDSSPIEMYAFYIERVRALLHVSLAFSPIGNKFKERLRIFPSLITGCTIDWFTSWPSDALIRVAETFIASMGLNRQDEEEVDSLLMSDSEKKASEEFVHELTELENSLVEMVIHFNQTVIDASERCFFELGRRNYVTPTAYLELLKTLKNFYSKKCNEISLLRDRYTIGLDKLGNAASQVGEMQENLYELQPQLKVIAEETDKIMVNIERETAEAEKKKEIVGADEAAANEAAAASQAIKDDCESDLAEAIPALQAALDALNTLKPADVTLVKSMKNPPAAVKLVLEAVCVLRGFKADRKPDPSGKVVDDYWGPSVKMLGDLKFLENLKNFDKDNIPPPIIKKIRDRYISDRDFDPDKIKSVSTACEGLCRWVRAMDVYDKVAKIVAPKQAALAEAESELSAQMEKLNAKRAELQEILDKLQKLNDFFAEKSRQKKGLEDDIDMCEKKLTRAEKLLGGLGGEKTRWSEAAETLGNSLNNIIGDVLLSAGVIAYLGFFTTEYRVSIAEDWNDLCHQKKIPCSEKFSLAVTLGNPMQIRAWSLCGLPSDNFSVENGIIVSSANRFPLMIDPQGQANKWVKNMEKNNELKVIKQTDDNYMKILENSIIFGFPVLLENVGETIDSNLTTVLEKNIIKQKGQLVIKFGDAMIDYNPNFRFYITTCLKNPIYSPETVVMVTLLNFMITEQGLREQLLATVVAYERPDLQEKKEQLIVESARNRDMLYNIESKILEVLSSSEGNVLEDENAINILSSSKTLSEDIQAKQIVAVATEIEIDEARQRYVPVAKHSAILFFCITELSNIDPMYQYSLGWFINLFINTILKAPKSNVLSERLQNLNDYFTKSVYINVCRSLFEKDKLVISFVMCLGILVSREEIEKPHLIFFLTGGVGLENPHPNPAPKWLSDKAWSEIVRSSNLSGLENFYQRFAENVNKWQDFYELISPDEEPFPSPYEGLEQVHRLIVLKCLRPDKVVPAVRTFITKNMDRSFVESPPFDLAASFAESSPTIPLVFLLSPGSDPMASVLAFAKSKGMSDKVKSISLGQGQGPRAEKMIYEAVRHGAWVILQNCHVAISWMNELERICSDDTIAETAHADYRLWCTSYPSPVFPVSVLQNSVKMTNEAPKGLKMNMLRSFGSDPLARDKFYSNAFIGKSAKYWLRGVFALVFFHAVINERKEFGPLGWNIPYEFGESDLKISLLQLKMFIAQNESIPFHGHVYLTGECNYGGRVTDDKDRRLLISLLTMVYNQDTIDIDNYPLSSSGDYRVPLIPNRVNSQAYISTFPLSPKPEVFGLHENADINRNNKETNSLLSGVLLTQTDLLASTKKSSSAKADTVDPAFFICKEILGRLPKKFDTEEVLVRYPIIYTNSMNTVLRQELIRFNRLLDFIRKSLIDIGKAVQGQIAMIPQLERVHKAMVIGKLPPDWVAKSYPSLKPLGSYVNDFLARLEFFQTWIDRGEPSVYWLSGFYFTQSFLTGVLQNLSRKKRYQIDLVTIRFDLTAFETDVPETPEVGAYVRGLYLEAARWNREAFCLDESRPKVLFDLLPIIFAMPMLKTEIPDDPEHLYDAPAYKTSERRGTLSTTGHSTNFVMFMKIPTVKKPMHWINRGTAILCQLDD